MNNGIRLATRCLVAVCALLAASCGGGGDGGADESDAQDNAPAPSPPRTSAALPPVSSRYVFSEGRVRDVSDAKGRSLVRKVLEDRLFLQCNMLRALNGQPEQSIEDIPLEVREIPDRFTEEQMYDAATGAGREVRYRAAVELSDLAAAMSASPPRAPDCLMYSVHQMVQTRIWGRDGYYYEISGPSVDLAGSVIRTPMKYPTDVNWGRVPAEQYEQRPVRMIQGWACHQAPTVKLADLHFDHCHLDPDGDIVFRNLPLSLDQVTHMGVRDGVAAEELSSRATRVSFDRADFGRWSDVPLDQLPELEPGVTIEDR